MVGAGYPAQVPEPSVDPTLSPAVRRRVLEVAAVALGALPDGDVPAALRRVRSFAPARRAVAGAVPLAAALAHDDGFRGKVAAAIADAEPGLVEALHAGTTPHAADPVDVAAAAYLLRPDGWAEILTRTGASERERHEAGAGEQARATADRLAAQLAAARAEVDAVRAAERAERERLEQELATLRRELRRHRSDADRARAQAREALTQAAAQQEAAERLSDVADERLRRAAKEGAAARETVEALRRAERGGRSLAGARARLLLDTLLDAATGLRQELALPPAGTSPAEAVAASLVGDSGGAGDAAAGLGAAARGRAEDDPNRLDELLALPQAHLVVDGYNVTKGAYGSLPLLDQRRRLVAGLSGLAARTRAEVTCVFDGAVVDGRSSAIAARGVRVLFSDPGETADELVRQLVRAEPRGRVVVVASSDREVADGVRAAGARPVPSAALARLLDRG